MIKADGSSILKEYDNGSIRGCEVSVVGEYGQIMGEYQAITNAFIDTVLKKAPKEYKYEVANDIIGVLQSGANKVVLFIKDDIKEDKNA